MFEQLKVPVKQQPGDAVTVTTATTTNQRASDAASVGQDGTSNAAIVGQEGPGAAASYCLTTIFDEGESSYCYAPPMFAQRMRVLSAGEALLAFIFELDTVSIANIESFCFEDAESYAVLQHPDYSYCVTLTCDTAPNADGLVYIYASLHDCPRAASSDR